tara:strand:- start:3690 stop:3905 length:216 start_codon:yes stop_codon:yes gene_type:complete
MTYEDIVKGMEAQMSDDPHTGFVVLISNGGGIALYHNLENMLNYDTNPPTPSKITPQSVVKMWHDEFERGK